MEAHNGTWAKQMDIVEEGLHTSIYAPKDSTIYTFSFHHMSIGIASIYSHPELARDTQPANNASNTPTYHMEKNNNSNALLEICYKLHLAISP